MNGVNNMGYHSIKDLVDLCKANKCELWQVIMRDNANEHMISEKQVFDNMKLMYAAMKKADNDYNKNLKSPSEMAGGDGELMHIYNKSGKNICGDFISTAMEKAIKMGESNACMKRIQKEYEDKIHIRIGIELGLQTHLQEFYQKLTQQYPFDFVIGSVHLVDGKDPYYREGFAELSDRELYRKGFENTLENLQHVTAFDVLGHLDYVVRYGTYKEKEYSQTEFSDIIDEILKRVIELGKGIELNTAGWKYGLPFCNPHPDVLKRYRELGGEIITIGADGHKPEHIAYDFGKVNDVLKACGFKYYTEFEERKPIFKQLT